MNITANRCAGIAATLCLALLLPGLARGAADPAAQARQVVTLLAKRDFAGVARNFDATVSKALPAAKLGQVWDGVLGQAGPFKKQIAAKSQKVNQNGQRYDAVSVTCQFEKARLDVNVVYDAAGKIAGFFIKPTQE